MEQEKVNKYRGVSWHKHKKRYRAKLKADARHIHLGYFDDPESAAQVWDFAAELVQGPAAKKNFPGPTPLSDEAQKGVRDTLVRKRILRDAPPDLSDTPVCP